MIKFNFIFYLKIIICNNPKIMGIIPKQIKVIKKYFIPPIIILNSKEIYGI